MNSIFHHLGDMDKLINSLRKDLNLFGRTLRFVWDSGRHLVFLRLVTIILNAVLSLVPLYLIKLLIDGLAEDLAGWQSMWWIIGIYGLVTILIIANNNISSYITKIQADKVSDHMTEVVLEKSIELDLAHYDSHEYHDTFHRAQLQAGHRPTALLSAITQLLQHGMVLIAIATLLTTLHWAIGLIMILVVAPIAAVQFRYVRILYDWKELNTPKERKANYLRHILTTIPYAKEVRLFSYGQQIKKQFGRIRSFLLKEKRSIYVKQSLSLSLVQIIEAIATIGVLIYIIHTAIA